MEQVRKGGLPPLFDSLSGGKPPFLTCSIQLTYFPFVGCLLVAEIEIYFQLGYTASASRVSLQKVAFDHHAQLIHHRSAGGL